MIKTSTTTSRPIYRTSEKVESKKRFGTFCSDSEGFVKANETAVVTDTPGSYQQVSILASSCTSSTAQSLTSSFNSFPHPAYKRSRPSEIAAVISQNRPSIVPKGVVKSSIIIPVTVVEEKSAVSDHTGRKRIRETTTIKTSNKTIKCENISGGCRLFVTALKAVQSSDERKR